MKTFFLKIWKFLNLRAHLTRKRQVMRRANYEFLKAEISKRHFAGFAGLVVNFPGRSFDLTDMACFPSPMYRIVQNMDRHWCIFWDRSRLTREIGVGAPLKDGEVTVSDVKVRTKPEGTLETIDEQKPLVITVPSLVISDVPTFGMHREESNPIPLPMTEVAPSEPAATDTKV